MNSSLQIFFLSILVGVFLSCKSAQNPVASISNDKDSSIIITPYNSKCKVFYSSYHDTLFQYNEYKRWNPSTKEVLKADSIAMKCVLHNEKATNLLKEKLGSPYYIRQYIGIIDSIGNKLLFINYICEKLSESKGFEKHIVGLDDGFDCSFDLLFDMKTMQCRRINILTK